MGPVKNLKTASDQQKSPEQDDDGDFNLFTLHKLREKGKKIPLSYEQMREAILELYLSVKVRSDEEIEVYNQEMFNVEKR